ncbi:TetR/AcrR family transcriptional regulator [Paractinoplanes globisporus]|uniref:TetR/AcrR family transcriptional regulator n=1 Tax=Paractinoplanes globisporus TaxID=113565 RepID=A0ABW6WLJ8_9ACTN|nr:TetR/AcrR family transcriptional regulator [Actinoplanes globisporus]
MENRRRRVPALAPEERRQALIAATIPLLHEHGLEVSTRQIATAAGVAEGTIFGVFESKNSLVVCSVIQALDPQVTLDGLEAIDLSLPLRERMAEAAELIHARMAENAQLLTAARKLIFAGAGDPDAQARMASSRERLRDTLIRVIEPDAALLRRTPHAVAQMLLLFCGANTYGPFGDPDSFRGTELVSLLLDGVLIRNEELIPTEDRDKRGAQY